MLNEKRNKSRSTWMLPRPYRTNKFHVMQLIVKPFYESNWLTTVKLGIPHSILWNERVCGEEEWTFIHIFYYLTKNQRMFLKSNIKVLYIIHVLVFKFLMSQIGSVRKSSVKDDWLGRLKHCTRERISCQRSKQCA